MFIPSPAFPRMPKNGPQSIEAKDFTTLARIADIFLIYRDRATKSAPDFEIPLTFSGYVKAMTDGVGNINSSIAPVAKRPSVYQSESIREIRARAESIRQHTSPEEPGRVDPAQPDSRPEPAAQRQCAAQVLSQHQYLGGPV